MAFKAYFLQFTAIATLRSRYRWFAMVTFAMLLFSCISPYEPIETIDETQISRQKMIEDTLLTKHGEDTYISMAFGQLTVHKPPSFRKLDSLYAIKQNYIENDDLRGLHASGIEDIIPAYRAEAQQDIDKVTYEIEHIYGVRNDDSINVQHTYFTFNHEDEIQTISPLYAYGIHNKFEDLHEKYLYGFHFTTDRDLRISTSEKEFLQLFKQREWELAKEDEGLEPFMNHTFELMKLAQKVNSVDFRTLAKFSSIQHLKSLKPKASISIEEFGKLMILENDNDQVVGYEYKIVWKKEGGATKATTFTFSPFLKHKSYITHDYEN
ncbi:MAG: hypothetical protein ACQERC_07305 [Bacteroidota bacterium]